MGDIVNFILGFRLEIWDILGYLYCMFSRKSTFFSPFPSGRFGHGYPGGYLGILKGRLRYIFWQS